MVHSLWPNRAIGPSIYGVNFSNFIFINPFLNFGNSNAGSTLVTHLGANVILTSHNRKLPCFFVFASTAISLFESTLDKVVALAILMPIVASMGGVAGSQTLTVVIRGMALGQIERGNINWLLSKEFAVGALNGLLYALIVGCVVSVWFQDATMALIIGLAMAINLIAAALSGTLLPVVLKKLNIDPALAGTVILTTITDVVGFVSFLGLATVFLA